jgi:hypothetical protein
MEQQQYICGKQSIDRLAKYSGRRSGSSAKIADEYEWVAIALDTSPTAKSVQLSFIHI